MGATADIDRVRAEVADAGRALATSGLVTGVAGNVSARAGDLLAVTPTGARLATLTADQIAVVDKAGTLVDGPLAPSSELPLHLAIYRRFDAAAVVHAHPPMATAVACVADELPCIHYSLLTLGGDVRVARYATFGSPDLAASVVEALDGRRAALMGSHGAVTYGADLEAAIEAAELLEWACGVYVHARACGSPRVLAEEERRAVVDALSTYAYGRTRRAPPAGSGAAASPRPAAANAETVELAAAQAGEEDGGDAGSRVRAGVLDWPQKLTLQAVEQGESEDTPARDALVEAGLVEQREDGSYVVTAAGRAVLEDEDVPSPWVRIAWIVAAVSGGIAVLAIVIGRLA